MCLRAVVTEEAYGVLARVTREEFRSDEIATGFRIASAVRAAGREPELVTGEEGVLVRLFLGDAAPESEYEEAAGLLLEAASW